MSRITAPAAPEIRFRRGAGERPISRTVHRLPVRVRQILVLCGVAGATFFAASRVMILVLSWKNLEIRTVQVRSADPAVQAAAERMAGEMGWGNILALDIARVQARFRANPWIKEISVRKVLPSMIRIDIEPRVPVAVLDKDVPVLVDAEGVELGSPGPEAAAALPLFRDGDGFRSDASQKIRLGWACLQEIDPRDRADVESLELGGPGGLVLKFRSAVTRLKLGDGEFGPKVGLYRERENHWAREFGEIEYLDLRFPDRIFVKAAAAVEKPEGRIPAAKETR